MRCRQILTLAMAVSAVFVAGYDYVLAQTPPPPPTPVPAGAPNAERQNEFESLGADNVLLRGPVHEGFAAPMSQATPSEIIVTEPPPEPIAEQPPEFRPEQRGTRLDWLPGYWAWDPSDRRYVWAAGIWRNVPPGMQWVPGYWEQVEGGHRWVSGFWTSENTASLSYLPPPPAPPPEEQPTETPLHEGLFWVPGCWRFDGAAYQWRPGFWAQAQDGWVWTPASYVWSPEGVVFVDGYWDYAPESRGVLFAPMITDLRRPLPAQGFSPWVTIDPRAMLAHLFVNPQSRHYYFGDYYDFGPQGWLPWTSLSLAGGYYDPLAAYYWAAFPQRFKQFKTDHLYFAQNAALRPPIFWSQYGDWAKRGPKNAGYLPLAAPLLALAETGQFAALSPFERDFYWQSAQLYRSMKKSRGNAAQFFSGFGQLGLPPGHGGVPPGHGGIPPGQAKKWGAFGPSIPPGQIKKFESGNGKGGGGKGKGKGR